MGCKAEPFEKEEGAGDFKALRAMFQNNSNFSNALLQPQKKPSVEIIPWQSTRDSSTSTSKHHPFWQVQVPSLERKTELLPSMLQKSEMIHVKPVVLPRVKIRELPEMSKNEPRKRQETLARGTTLVVEPQNQRPKSCLDPQETAAANDAFHRTLQIWESSSSWNDPKCSMRPLPHANRTTFHGQSRPLNVAVIAEGKAKTVENEQASILAAPENPPHLHSEPAPSPTTSPPIPPRRPVSLQTMASGAPQDTGFSLTADALDRQSKNVQCSNEIHHDVEEIKLPKLKSLPSAVSLGPPPKKPPRPPKVDISTFQQNLPDAGDDPYVTPENTATEGQSTHDETIPYPKQPESSTRSFTVQETTHSSKAEKKEDIQELNTVLPDPLCVDLKIKPTVLNGTYLEKQRFPIATPSTEMEDVKKRGPLWDHEVPEQQANEMGKIGDPGGMLAKVKINGESRGGKNMLQEETAQSLPGTRLAKAGNYGYVFLETLKMDEEKAQTLELGRRTPQLVPAVEELYDDVEGLGQASDTISSLPSDTFSEETYEDIQGEDYNSMKLDSDKVEKPKKFGKLFKKGKFHMKNAYLKENSRSLSRSVPNLEFMAQESIVYDDIGTEQDDTKEKNEIHKNWKLKFLASKEKGRRRSSDEAEITPSRNFFKTKKYNFEKNNKEAKEEKLFREKFMYEKKIKVINTAVAHCSNTSTKNELDLRITAGEQLDVIDITEGNQLICRNAEGKYGYVLVEHLNFRLAVCAERILRRMEALGRS